jgi:hypothetical protein
VVSKFTLDLLFVQIGTEGEVIDFVCEIELVALLNDFADS